MCLAFVNIHLNTMKFDIAEEVTFFFLNPILFRLQIKINFIHFYLDSIN